jgi:gluconokinase
MSSQLAALEPLAPDEDGTIVDAALDMPEQVRDGLRRLGLTDPVE